MIIGLSSVNAEKLVDVILENGESIDSFVFPTEIIKHANRGTIIQIKRKNNKDYYFKMIRIPTGNNVTYSVSFLPGNIEERPFFCRQIFNDFSQVMEQFNKWLGVMKGLQGSADNIIVKTRPVSNASIVQHGTVQVPKMEIRLSDIQEQEKRLIDLLLFDEITGCLYNIHETLVLEYKENFEWDKKSSRGKYIKTLANFANSHGGYIVFGIADDGKIVGIDIDEFNKVNNADIYKFINSYFTGNIYVGRICFKLNGVDLGAFYVGKAPVELVIHCTRDLADDTGKYILLKEDCYYRQNGGNSKIPFEILLQKAKDILIADAKIVFDNKKVETVNENTTNKSVINKSITDDTIRQNDIKPIFIAGGAMYSNNLTITMLNIGERAKIETIESDDESNNLVVTGFTKGYIENKQEVNITGSPIVQDRNLYKFHIRFVYSDKDGRRYRQKITVEGTTGVRAEDAELVQV